MKTSQAFRCMVAEDVDLIAQLLGLTPRQLSIELDGQSVARGARAHGVAPPYVLDVLLARCLRRIAAAVDSGRISAESGLDAYPRLANRTAWRVYRRW